MLTKKKGGVFIFKLPESSGFEAKRDSNFYHIVYQAIIDEVIYSAYIQVWQTMPPGWQTDFGVR